MEIVFPVLKTGQGSHVGLDCLVLGAKWGSPSSTATLPIVTAMAMTPSSRHPTDVRIWTNHPCTGHPHVFDTGPAVIARLPDVRANEPQRSLFDDNGK